MTGHVVASLLRNLLATFLVIGVGLAVGWRPTGSALDWLAAIGVLIVLFILALSWLAAAVGLFAGSPEAANGMHDRADVPALRQHGFRAGRHDADLAAGFAEHQPVTPVIETLRGLWMGTPIDNQPSGRAWCLGILVVAMVVGGAPVHATYGSLTGPARALAGPARDSVRRAGRS